MKTAGLIFGMYIALHGAINWATDYRDALQAKEQSSYYYVAK